MKDSLEQLLGRVRLEVRAVWGKPQCEHDVSDALAQTAFVVERVICSFGDPFAKRVA